MMGSFSRAKSSDDERGASVNDVTGMPQNVVVLGGSSDLARALLRELCDRRLKTVLLAGRTPAALDIVAKELRELGAVNVETASFDARDAASHDALAEEAASRLGSVDLVIIAAGVLGSSELDDLDAEQVADEITTNFTGPAAAMVAFARIMRRQGFGRIVVLSSAAAVRVRRANFVYGSAKAGLDGFSQGLGDALRGTGIDVIVVRPGWVKTKMTEGRPKMPLSTSPAAVADAIVKALETGEEVVWVPGVLRFVMSVVPHIPRRLWSRMPG